MVSSLSIVAMLVSTIVVFGLPMILAIIFIRRYGASLVAVGVGVLGFLVPQVLIRIPALQWLSQQPFYQQWAAQPWLIGLFLSLTAGLFEETGRWIGFRYLLRNRLQFKNGLAYGVGHGGFEAIFLVGLSYINLITFSLMINNGTFDSLVAPQLGLAAEQIRTQLISTPSYLYLVGGLERVFAIAIQLGLSVLVFYSVKRQKARLYWLAVLLHTVVNLPAVLLSSTGIGILWIELWVAVCAGVAVWYVIHSHRREQQAFMLTSSAEIGQNSVNAK
ncbi:MAG: YhfC family intramembrane metalloprotease [Bellilinea sp.]|nr:YhfC family intramembrane metalloprotease [Bellilinea sp.]